MLSFFSIFQGMEDQMMPKKSDGVMLSVPFQKVTPSGNYGC
jgi:hypothetical protein